MLVDPGLGDGSCTRVVDVLGSWVEVLGASSCVVVLGVLGASAVVVVLGVHQLLTNSVQEAERSLAVLTSTELGSGEHA